MLKQDNRINEILRVIYTMFPNAHCELNYRNVFELSVATILSAQTTDKSVNKVTPELFLKYPTPFELAEANEEDVFNIIKTIGLARTKTKNIVSFAKKLVNNFDGVVPDSFDDLVKLPGVGRKTANVILTEGFNVPRIPVDTHVERVSKRLMLVDESDSVLTTEMKLMDQLDYEDWHLSHHLLLFFGRYHCLAKNPNCEKCPLKNECNYKNPLE